MYNDKLFYTLYTGWYIVIEHVLVGRYHAGGVGEVRCGKKVHGKKLHFKALETLSHQSTCIVIALEERCGNVVNLLAFLIW